MPNKNLETQDEMNNEQNSLEDPTLQSQQIPPTNPPKTSPTDGNETLLAVLREQNAVIERQNRELEQARTRVATPVQPEKTREELNKEYFEDPVGTMDRIFETKIDRALRETVAPLVDFVGKLKGESKIDQFVNQFKSDNRFSSKWNNKLERWVREQAAGVNPEQLNEQNFGIIVMNGFGMQAVGMLENDVPQAPPAPRNDNPSPPRNDMIPPHVRPSPRLPSQQDNGKPKLRELSELEARLAREKGMSKEEYLEWLDVPLDRVAASDIGRRQPPK